MGAVDGVVNSLMAGRTEGDDVVEVIGPSIGQPANAVWLEIRSAVPGGKRCSDAATLADAVGPPSHVDL
jgi:hypothetical protein